MKRIVKKFVVCSSFVVLMGIGANSVQAAFEWRPPKDVKSTNAPQKAEDLLPQVSAQPVAPVEIQQGSPMVVLPESSLVQAPAPMPMPMPMQAPEQAPVYAPVHTPAQMVPQIIYEEPPQAQSSAQAPLALVPPPAEMQPVQLKQEDYISAISGAPVEPATMDEPVVATQTTQATPQEEPRYVPVYTPPPTMSVQELNRPIRVKRDTVPSIYGDEAPLVLGKTPREISREQAIANSHQVSIVSSSKNVVIFDPDHEAPMLQYSDFETPKEFARAGVEPIFAPNVFQPSAPLSIVPPSVDSIVAETLPEPVPTPLRAEDYQRIETTISQTPSDIPAPSDIPVVSQNVVAMPLPQQQIQGLVPQDMLAPASGFAGRDMDDSVLQGFGMRVPLVIAVQQIAPEGYQFDFGQGVDMGALVDWQGGASWQNVMGRTLEPLGLSYHANDTQKLVSVYRREIGAERFVFAAETQPVAPVVVPQSSSQAVLVSQDQNFGNVQPIQDRERQALLSPPPVVEKELPRVPVQAPKVQDMTGDVWYGAKDSTLRGVLRDWASRANVELYWDSQFDYPLQATVVVKGSFEEAVQRVLEGFEQAQPRPLGRLHKNSQNGPSVLIVEANDLID